MTGINAWLDSNAYLKVATVDNFARAFMLRDRYVEVVALVIYLLHGAERMRELSMEIRTFFQAESFEEFMASVPSAATGTEP